MEGDRCRWFVYLLKTIMSWYFDFSLKSTSSTCKDMHCPGHNSLNSLNQPSLIKSIVKQLITPLHKFTDIRKFSGLSLHEFTNIRKSSGFVHFQWKIKRSVWKMASSEEALPKFHERVGSLVQLSNDNRTAQRNHPAQEFNNGVVIGCEPLKEDQLFEVRIDKKVVTVFQHVKFYIVLVVMYMYNYFVTKQIQFHSQICL